jgi:hypothetical protein
MHPAPALAHAALMMCGFMGTVIAIERAVAARQQLAWSVPLLSGAAGLLLLRGATGLAGALLAVAGLVTLVYALAGAPGRGWGSARTLGLLALALAVLAGFAVAERRARQPLVPAPLWRTRSLAAGGLVMLGATRICLLYTNTSPRDA